MHQTGTTIFLLVEHKGFLLFSNTYNNIDNSVIKTFVVFYYGNQVLYYSIVMLHICFCYRKRLIILHLMNVRHDIRVASAFSYCRKRTLFILQRHRNESCTRIFQFPLHVHKDDVTLCVVNNLFWSSYKAHFFFARHRKIQL